MVFGDGWRLVPPWREPSLVEAPPDRLVVRTAPCGPATSSPPVPPTPRGGSTEASRPDARGSRSLPLLSRQTPLAESVGCPRPDGFVPRGRRAGIARRRFRLGHVLGQLAEMTAPVVRGQQVMPDLVSRIVHDEAHDIHQSGRSQRLLDQGRTGPEGPEGLLKGSSWEASLLGRIIKSLLLLKGRHCRDASEQRTRLGGRRSMSHPAR